MNRQIILVAHDIRSCHNVGSLLRTADGLGVDEVYLTGYTPYPAMRGDKRLPHEAAKVDRQIVKTALGAEQSVEWKYEPEVDKVLVGLRKRGFKLVGLEQSPNSKNLTDFKPPTKVALIIGNEVTGLDSKLLALSSELVEIPMLGAKESFNVSAAAAIALYHLRFL